MSSLCQWNAFERLCLITSQRVATGVAQFQGRAGACGYIVKASGARDIGAAATSLTRTSVAGDARPSGHFRSKHRRSGPKVAAQIGNWSECAMRDPNRARRWLCFRSASGTVLSDFAHQLRAHCRSCPILKQRVNSPLGKKRESPFSRFRSNVPNDDDRPAACITAVTVFSAVETMP